MGERVVVTGMGVVTPLGAGTPSNWTALTNRPGLKEQRSASLDQVSRQNGGLKRSKELTEMTCMEALQDAGLWDGRALQGVDPERIGCTASASKPLFSDGARLGSDPNVHFGAKVDLTLVVHSPDQINRFVQDRFGLRGESRNVIAACATGAYSIALGASWIEQGLCDVVVAGSVEPYPHPLIQAGFQKMGVMSHEGVTRPFDRRRSGFTFGEGAGVVVLESERSARARGAQPYGQLTGWALGSDSHSAVVFNSNGARIAGVIDGALKRGGLPAKAVRHVNAHGTATRLNDWIETQALLHAFGPRSGELMVSATKASTGHLLGASGSVEFIFTVLALRHQFIPPTATLEDADPECPLDYTPQKGHSASFQHALSLSFGFGGPIGALVVSAC